LDVTGEQRPVEQIEAAGCAAKGLQRCSPTG
jgi:hypothetical protein